MRKILIQNAYIVDAGQNMEMVGDILLENGKIVQVAASIAAPGAEVIDATGLVATHGLVDMHVHLREPGQEHKEDIASGCAAAAAGGVTSLCCMPNTLPTVDSPEVVAFIKEKAAGAKAKVYPVAALTKGLGGKELTAFGALQEAGAVGISDDGRPVECGGMMLEALRLGKLQNLPILSHCEDLSIINGGIINKGAVSRDLKVKGMDRASEDSITAREIALAAASGTAVHICHVSTKGSVELIREAKARGVQVTAETAPHYLCLTEEVLRGKNANFRMNPPLRTAEDRDSLLAAVADGTIDAIATDHAPHSVEEKQDFLKAPNGVVGLETSFAVCYTKLVKERGMRLAKLMKLMSTNPARLMHLQAGSLAVGGTADIILIDTQKSWRVDASRFASKARNTPFEGMELVGKVVCTILDGVIVYEQKDGGCI